MSYLDSGFNENLIRQSEEEQQPQYDNVNIEDILTPGAIPISDVVGALAAGDIIDSDRNFIREVINTKLNTETNQILDAFTFGTSGAIQIGTYANGVTGDIRITPSGITSRNSSGANTIAINGATGAVTILGTLAAGSVVACDISASYIVAGTFDEAMNIGNANVKIDGANKRIIISDGTNDRVLIGYLAGMF